MQTQVKVFSIVSGQLEQIEQEINSWLKANPNIAVHSFHVINGSKEGGVLVSYEETPAPGQLNY